MDAVLYKIESSELTQTFLNRSNPGGIFLRTQFTARIKTQDNISGPFHTKNRIQPITMLITSKRKGNTSMKTPNQQQKQQRDDARAQEMPQMIY